jgi:mRNA-degrading endonuclease toxin of MazEF toxin-antitoxin module
VVRSDLLSELSYATVLPITSDVREGIGLRAPSQVMADWPRTLRLSEIGQSVGTLDPTTMQAITRQMAIVLGIGTGGGRSVR